MGLLDLLLVAVGLSMDAFAVSVCKGLNTKKHPAKAGLIAGVYSGKCRISSEKGVVCICACRT